MTKNIIEEPVKAYAENEVCSLKYYHFTKEVDTVVLNKLQAEHKQSLKEIDELDNL